MDSGLALRAPRNDEGGSGVFHALTLLIARRLVNEFEDLGPAIAYFVVPPLCPLVGSPYDF
jgi:NTE family protein